MTHVHVRCKMFAVDKKVFLILIRLLLEREHRTLNVLEYVKEKAGDVLGSSKKGSLASFSIDSFPLNQGTKHSVLHLFHARTHQGTFQISACTLYASHRQTTCLYS